MAGTLLGSNPEKHLSVAAAVFQSLPSDDNETLENSVGFISDHTEVKVIDQSGNPVPLGQPGELCVRGYMTLIDYYDDAEKTKEVLGADGWFRTGDQFVLYENGYANIVGRLKEMIIRGGENIYPREIEDFLNTHPDVKEAHVVGKLRRGSFQVENFHRKLLRNSRRAFGRRSCSLHKIQGWSETAYASRNPSFLPRASGTL